MNKLLVLLILIAPVSCFGKTPAVLEVNGISVSQLVFDNLYQEANEQKPLSRGEYRQKLVDLLVLGEYAARNHQELLAQTNVGYDPKLTLTLQVNRLLLRWFTFDEVKRKKAAIRHMRFILNPEDLTVAIGKPSILGYELTPKQRKAAEKVVVAEFALKQPELHTITLAQLYDEQSVQGRIAFHQGDINQIKKFAYDKFFVHWHRAQSVEREDFSTADLNALDKIVQGKFLEPALMLKLGALTSEHGNNEGLEPFKAKVTQNQIAAFYQANRKDFEHVSKARARLLTFNSQAEALKVADTLKSAADWRSAAKALGQTGWFPQAEKGWLNIEVHKSWLSTLAFALPQGKENPPIRGPQGQWYVVRVEQRLTDYYPLDSDTVVFAATNVLAQVEAAAAFKNLKQQLQHEAAIKYHER